MIPNSLLSRWVKINVASFRDWASAVSVSRTGLGIRDWELFSSHQSPVASPLSRQVTFNYPHLLNPVLPIDSSAKKSTSPTNKAPSGQPVHAFQNSFLYACFLFLGLIPFSAIIWFVVIAVWLGIKSHPIIAIALINVVGTAIIFHSFMVYISPRGIKAYDFWLRYHFVEWSSITTVRRFTYRLGLKYLLVSSTQSPKTLWVPLFLADRHRFGQLVSKYAGTEHTFTQCLFS